MNEGSEAMSKEYEVGGILHTTNGKFLIVSIEACSARSEEKELYGYGAIYIDDEHIQDYSLEMQYVTDEFEDLIKAIERDGEIIDYTSKQNLKDTLIKSEFYKLR